MIRPTSGRGAPVRLDTLADVVRIFQSLSSECAEFQKVLAAAVTLEESSTRDKKAAMRKMCTAWGVRRQEKKDGKWSNRSTSVDARNHPMDPRREGLAGVGS